MRLIFIFKQEETTEGRLNVAALSGNGGKIALSERGK